jgi:hypothetical protein
VIEVYLGTLSINRDDGDGNYVGAVLAEGRCTRN